MSTGLPGLQPGLTKALTDMPQSAAGPSISSSERASALRAAENSFAKAIKILTEPLNLTREVLDALGETPTERAARSVRRANARLRIAETQLKAANLRLDSQKVRLAVADLRMQTGHAENDAVQDLLGVVAASTSLAEDLADLVEHLTNSGIGVNDLAQLQDGLTECRHDASPSFDARPGTADTASVGEPGPGSGELPGPGTTTGGDQ